MDGSPAEIRGSAVFFQQPCLIIEIPRIPLVVLVAAVLSGGLLPLGVVSHVVLEHAGESHRRQHAHHRGQRQHQPHHHTGEVDGADGVQRHWRAKGGGRGGQAGGGG